MSRRRDDRWYEDRIAIVELLDYLTTTGEIQTARDAALVVEKPWHYTPEYRTMLAERAAEDKAEQAETWRRLATAKRRRPAA